MSNYYKMYYEIYSIIISIVIGIIIKNIYKKIQYVNCELDYIKREHFFVVNNIDSDIKVMSCTFDCKLHDIEEDCIKYDDNVNKKISIMNKQIDMLHKGFYKIKCILSNLTNIYDSSG